MNWRQVMLIAWAWRRLVLGLWLTVVAVTLGVSLLLPKAFTASTSIYVDAKPDPLLGNATGGLASAAYIQTQTEIIQSRRVATRVVKMLHISEIPSVFQNWKQDTEGKIPFEDYYGDILLKGLTVQPSRGSNIITLSYTAADSRFAASAANAFAQATLETNIELRVDPAREYAVWFDDRLKVLRQNLEAGQAKLSEFQRKNGIVASSGQALDQETTRLNSLNNELSVVLGQQADITSREKNAGNELSPDMMQNTAIQRIRADIAKTEADLSEIKAVVGKNHPQRLQLEAQLDTQQKQLAAETVRVSGGVASATRVSAQREQELRVAIDTQKKRVLELQEQRDQIGILQGDVETARRAYESVSQRMSMTKLETQSQQTNLSILSPAVEPVNTPKPRVLINTSVALVLGLLLAVGVALGLEQFDRRVRHRNDLTHSLAGVHYLGALMGDDKPRRRRVANFFRRFTRHGSALAQAS